jgi:hypothetical protein
MPMPKVKPTGVTEIETRLGAETVSEVDPEMLPSDAEMLLEPAALPVTSPDALTVATVSEEESHVTSALKSALLPSV